MKKTIDENKKKLKSTSKTLKELQGIEAMAREALEKAKTAAAAAGSPEEAAAAERVKAAEGALKGAETNRKAKEAEEAAKAAAEPKAEETTLGGGALTYTPEEIKKIEAEVQKGLDPKKWRAGVVESPENAERFGVPLYSIMYQPLEENGNAIEQPVKERPPSTIMNAAPANAPKNKQANTPKNQPFEEELLGGGKRLRRSRRKAKARS